MRWMAVLGAVTAACATVEGEGTGFAPASSYDDRLALLDLLVEHHPYPGAGTDGAWPDHRAGITLQTQWQAASGRATRDADGDLDGWWPNVNWTLSVWQFEAQQRHRGDLADVPLGLPDDARFAMPEDVGRMWAAYYEAIDRAHDDVAAGRLTPRQESERARELQQMMWDVHVAAVHEGLRRNVNHMNRLPPGENRFAISWGLTAVEYLAAANLPSDADTIGRMQTLLLPMRTVMPGDYGEALPADLTWHQHTALHGMDLLHEIQLATEGELFALWKNALARPRCAALCPYLLDQALGEGVENLPAYLYDVIDWISGVGERPSWAENGETLDCQSDGAGAMTCSAGGERLRYQCNLATGVRDWSCRTCLPDQPGTALFASLFCPDGSTLTPGGRCEVREAGAFATAACLP